MIKTYKISKPCNNFSFVLQGKDGNKQRYVFEGGSVINNVPARLVLRSEYSQQLLENSKPFKEGNVKLERVDEGGEKSVAETNSVTVMEDITSPEQLVEFVATNLEKVYQRPEAALNYAKGKGYEFPNLELKKEQQ